MRWFGGVSSRVSSMQHRLKSEEEEKKSFAVGVPGHPQGGGLHGLLEMVIARKKLAIHLM